jgi:hypothetical protein
VSQQRIIVRTVDIALEVADVASAIDGVAGVAQQMGGWVVSSDRSQRHQGRISVRVPAARLDEAVLRIRELALEVRSEASTSKDVTDEYLDATARVKNLQATEAALIKILDRADKVEDALRVQQELTRVQEQIEQYQGRIKFLEETAAFSLINVSLILTPVDMPVDLGPDRTVSVGQFARFRASFRPPQGIDSFTFVWDFGDGTRVSTSANAPAPEAGVRVTSAVTHQYADDRDSPFFAEVAVTGTGDAGVAEGKDITMVTVTKIPTIEVFAGEDRTVQEGEEVEFVGTFTRPEGLSNLRFRWDFGDGSLPATRVLEEGITRAVVRHIYPNHRPSPYIATLTIMADSEAGRVEGASSIRVQVTESQSLIPAGLAPDEHAKRAVWALVALGQGLFTALIYVGIFSPLWLLVGAVAFVLMRRNHKS